MSCLYVLSNCYCCMQNTNWSYLRANRGFIKAHSLLRQHLGGQALQCIFPPWCVTSWNICRHLSQSWKWVTTDPCRGERASKSHFWICGVYMQHCPQRQEAETERVKVNIAFPEYTYWAHRGQQVVNKKKQHLAPSCLTINRWIAGNISLTKLQYLCFYSFYVSLVWGPKGSVHQNWEISVTHIQTGNLHCKSSLIAEFIWSSCGTFSFIMTVFLKEMFLKLFKCNFSTAIFINCYQTLW